MADARTVIAGILTQYMPRGWGVHDEAADDVLTALTAAGLIVTPEHDAAVRKAALDEAAAVCDAEARSAPWPDRPLVGEEPTPGAAEDVCAKRIRAVLAAAFFWLGAWHGPVPAHSEEWPAPCCRWGVKGQPQRAARVACGAALIPNTWSDIKTHGWPVVTLNAGMVFLWTT